MPKRLIAWTGERMVPWADEPSIIHEHLHRYLFSAALVDGKAVLDLGSGEGYGSHILSRTAARVVGIELDTLAVSHARLNYPAPNLEFVEGSVLKLDDFEDGSFDVAVCFEVIEHISDHEGLVSGVARVLRPGGVFVVSTPDRDVYNATLGHVNPYHLKELDRQEFSALLRRHFEHVAMYGQRATVGSLLSSLEGTGSNVPHSHIVVQRGDGSSWEQVAEPQPKYLVAVASQEPLPPMPSSSLLTDSGLEAPPGEPMHVRHPILGVALLGARSVVHVVRKRLALAMRERNRRKERRG
jgi:SAM-dependent methyltransferase